MCGRCFVATEVACSVSAAAYRNGLDRPVLGVRTHRKRCPSFICKYGRLHCLHTHLRRDRMEAGCWQARPAGIAGRFFLFSTGSDSNVNDFRRCGFGFVKGYRGRELPLLKIKPNRLSRSNAEHRVFNDPCRGVLWVVFRHKCSLISFIKWFI